MKTMENLINMSFKTKFHSKGFAFIPKNKLKTFDFCTISIKLNSSKFFFNSKAQGAGYKLPT